MGVTTIFCQSGRTWSCPLKGVFVKRAYTIVVQLLLSVVITLAP